MKVIDVAKPQEPAAYIEGTEWDRVTQDYIRQYNCLLYTSPSPRDKRQSRMPSSA